MKRSAKNDENEVLPNALSFCSSKILIQDFQKITIPYETAVYKKSPLYSYTNIYNKLSCNIKLMVFYHKLK